VRSNAKRYRINLVVVAAAAAAAAAAARVAWVVALSDSAYRDV